MKFEDFSKRLLKMRGITYHKGINESRINVFATNTLAVTDPNVRGKGSRTRKGSGRKHDTSQGGVPTRTSVETRPRSSTKEAARRRLLLTSDSRVCAQV